MLDAILINKIYLNLKSNLNSGKIQKIYHLNKNEIIFKIRSNKENHTLFNSIHPIDYRLHLSDIKYETQVEASNFTSVLRKHLDGGIITDIAQPNLDRVIIFTIEKRNEIKDIEVKHLVFELFGRHSNTFLCDNEYHIIDSLKPINFSESSLNNSRKLYRNATYVLPKSDIDNINITLDEYLKDITYDKIINKEYNCFSKQLINEIKYRNINNIDFNKTINEIIDSYNIYYYEDNIFSSIKLLEKDNLSKEFNDINKAIDYIYQNNLQKETIKTDYQPMILELNNLIKRKEKKIIRLHEQINKANNSNHLQKYGTLIYENIYLFNPSDHLNEIKIFDYDSNEDVIIKLDTKLSIKENAASFLKRYKKLQNSIKVVNEQIDICNYEINEISLALSQIEISSYNDIKEIILDLEENKYLKKSKVNKKMKKNYQPNYLKYLCIDNTEILVGRNNIQNDYITFKIANRLDTWMHVKGIPGAHVIIRDPNPSEESIRMAANLAAHYSKARYSSNVGVDYTLVKNVKKIKGSKLGFVTFDTNKSIFIDPDEALVLKYNLVKE